MFWPSGVVLGPTSSPWRTMPCWSNLGMCFCFGVISIPLVTIQLCFSKTTFFPFDRNITLRINHIFYVWCYRMTLIQWLLSNVCWMDELKGYGLKTKWLWSKANKFFYLGLRAGLPVSWWGHFLPPFLSCPSQSSLAGCA